MPCGGAYNHHGFVVTGWTAIGAGRVELFRRSKPDVVVMEVKLTLENTKQILADIPSIQVHKHDLLDGILGVARGYGDLVRPSDVPVASRQITSKGSHTSA